MDVVPVSLMDREGTDHHRGCHLVVKPFSMYPNGKRHTTGMSLYHMFYFALEICLTTLKMAETPTIRLCLNCSECRNSRTGAEHASHDDVLKHHQPCQGWDSALVTAYKWREWGGECFSSGNGIHHVVDEAKHHPPARTMDGWLLE